MSLSPFRPQRDRTLQVNQCGSHVSLLTQHETQQVVGLAIIRIEDKGLAKLIRGGPQIAASDRFLATFVQIVCRTPSRWNRFLFGSALLLQLQQELFEP